MFTLQLIGKNKLATQSMHPVRPPDRCGKCGSHLDLVRIEVIDDERAFVSEVPRLALGGANC